MEDHWRQRQLGVFHGRDRQRSAFGSGLREREKSGFLPSAAGRTVSVNRHLGGTGVGGRFRNAVRTRLVGDVS